MLVLAVPTSKAAVGDEIDPGKPGFRLAVEAFHLGYDGGETDSSVSGVELWLGVQSARWSLRSVIPAIQSVGASSVVSLGAGAGAVGRRSRGDSPGDGPGTTSARSVSDSASATSAGDTIRRGLGDVRLSAAVLLGAETAFGSWWGRAGVKAPTADVAEGLGTGEWDEWAGVSWFREGWSVDFDAYVRWVRLGDPLDLDFQDGLEGGAFCEWPLGRLAIGAGLEASQAGFAGQPVRVTASGYLGGPMGARSNWEIEILAGLTQSAPTMGLAAAWRF